MRLPSQIILVVMLAAATTAAELSPVKLTVTKSEHKDYQMRKGEVGHPFVDASREHAVSRAVTYTIEVVNVGSSVTKSEIRWSALVNHPGHRLWVAEGKQSCDLLFGRKFSFETEPIELRNGNTVIEGYCVEVWQDGKVVSSAVEPAGVKARIESLKSKQGKQTRKQDDP